MWPPSFSDKTVPRHHNQVIAIFGGNDTLLPKMNLFVGFVLSHRKVEKRWIPATFIEPFGVWTIVVVGKVDRTQTAISPFPFCCRQPKTMTLSFCSRKRKRRLYRDLPTQKPFALEQASCCHDLFLLWHVWESSLECYRDPAAIHYNRREKQKALHSGF
jgi:hypothetical protein